MKTPVKNTDWSSVATALSSATGIVITTHKNPDSDGIGSQIALFHALSGMGKRVWMHNLDRVPRICRYLGGSDRATSGSKFEHLHEVDTIISVDCAAISRLGMPESFFAEKTVVNIDHHASNQNFGHVNVVDAGYCATGAMIYDLLLFLEVELTPAMAAPLYVALLTDTASFRLSTVDAGIFRFAAELVEAGADPAMASKAVYGSNSFARLELLKLSLNTLELHDQQRSAWLHVTGEMYRQAHADTEDTEGFIDYGRGISGVGVTIFVRPGGEGRWKVSFRGADTLDVGSLASELGGGGHRYAAGCDLHGSLDEVKERVRPLVTRLLSN